MPHKHTILAFWNLAVERFWKVEIRQARNIFGSFSFSSWGERCKLGISSGLFCVLKLDFCETVQNSTCYAILGHSRAQPGSYDRFGNSELGYFGF